VGIVLVSHSARLAEGVAELLRQLGADEVPIGVAGGTPDGGIGTDYELVARAIRQADADDGVVVFADLGSAVLTVKTVLADQPDDRVRLMDAPLVEGAVAAASMAAAGADLDEVVRAAESARDFRKL
jgi:phosphoenolpyruvate---glycerone phosphotransferase subunit DhaM